MCSADVGEVSNFLKKVKSMTDQSFSRKDKPQKGKGVLSDDIHLLPNSEAEASR